MFQEDELSDKHNFEWKMFQEDELSDERKFEIKIFNKWTTTDVNVSDLALSDYIALKGPCAKYLPHTAGRYAKGRFRKAQCNIVERLVCALMMHGRNTGKKQMAMNIVRHALEIIQLLTMKNPIQVLVNAVQNSGPREEPVNYSKEGSSKKNAADVSPLRRVNLALFHLTNGARKAAFRNIKSIAECLADELISASKGSSSSKAIKKKDEIERVAKGCR